LEVFIRCGQRFPTVQKFDIETLRSVLADERMNARLTQQEVASSLGCSRKWVSRFERGLSVPSLETVVAYASLFGVSVLMEIPARNSALGDG